MYRCDQITSATNPNDVRSRQYLIPKLLDNHQVALQVELISEKVSFEVIKFFMPHFSDTYI